MKLIIQIPCYNEEEFIPAALSSLPREVEGFDTVEYLVIDDGSSDRTVTAAELAGAHHILRLGSHKGLAAAFTAGIQRCLELGADVIVNTDADCQYDHAAIPELVRPILDGSAGMAVGTRPIDSIRHFSPVKKFLQKLGSRVVSMASGLDIGDAPSGFRAICRDAALRLNIFTEYTYTLESLIQAGSKGIRVVTVPVEVNDKTRESRLVKSTASYVFRSLRTIAWIVLIYKPYRVFSRLSLGFFAAGMLIGVRFLYYYLSGGGRGHVQSLILLSVLVTLGLGSLLIAVFAGLISVNRTLTEDVQYRLRKIEYRKAEDG